MNRTLENITIVHIDNFIIKVWRRTKESEFFINESNNIDIIDLVNSFSAMPNSKSNTQYLLSKIEALPNISAVEILNKDGDGVFLDLDQD